MGDHDPIMIIGICKPHGQFSLMVYSHWDGLGAYCKPKPENKVALGFVEGPNNKNRGIQRRAYGLPDQEYPCLQILTCMPRPL